MSDSTWWGWLRAFIDALKQSILQAEERRLIRREIELVQENARLGGSPDGFFYRGLYYSCLDASIRAKGQKGNLHSSLVPTMNSHLRDRAAVQFDQVRVHQALVLLLRNCRTPQDVRDALPDFLAETTGIKNLPRTRPEAYTLVDNPRASQQYQRLREKLEFYNVMKLLY